MRAILFAPVAVALGIVACGKAATPEENLESQYNMMQRAGASEDELCDQALKIERAYLEAGDEQQYRSRRLTANSTCLDAQIKDRLAE